VPKLRRGRTLVRRGAAAVEMAVLLPFLVLMFLGVLDFCRVFYFSMMVENCARNGAMYASDPLTASESPYPNVEAAALAGAANLSPSPTVSSFHGSDSDGQPYVAVTVSYPFVTISNYPGLPVQFHLTRTVQLTVAPSVPNN
jgi:Flp pilus assembly protein TadG